jgi:tetratricopeptide (TPR) repeat protein
MREDPITRASRVFLAEAEAFFRARKGPVLPMIAPVSARSDLVKALRRAELARKNRRPLFLYDEPFVSTHRWGDGLARAIEQDYEALRGGAEAEGVTLPPFASDATDGMSSGGETESPLLRAVKAIERVAALLASRLDGVLVALLPAHIEDARAYRAALTMLVTTSFSRPVRLAVHCPPGGPLEGVLPSDGARFHVDADELAAYLKPIGDGGESAGPQLPPPLAPKEEQRNAFEQETGRKLPDSEAARRLRGLLLEAGAATGRGDHEAAGAGYGEARSLCQREGLALEEAVVLTALGGACLAADKVTLAIDAYTRSETIAHTLEAWPVVCQAWFGAAGAHFTAGRYEAAALAYRAAADAAQRGALGVLGIEALRMAGICHQLLGASSTAIDLWQEAVTRGLDLSAKARRASPFAHVTEALFAMLEELQMGPQAAELRALVAAGEAEPVSPSREHAG